MKYMHLCGILLGVAAVPVPRAVAQAGPETGSVSNLSRGESQVRRMRLEFKARKMVSDACWEYGCLVVVNETRRYDVVEFYVNIAPANQEPQWGRNQFKVPLRPMKAILTPKVGDMRMCAQPVRFVLQNRKTKQKLHATGTASLCATPHADSILRIRVYEPQVIWDLPDEPAN